MKLVQTMVALAVLGISLSAQEAGTTSPSTAGGDAARGAKAHSPEVLADGRVTFRLLAPKATEVSVQGNWERGRTLPMTKDESGLWSYTTPGPLQPEL
jgi:enterochelin esterase family protein